MSALFGAIEAGGTAFRCAVGDGNSTTDFVEFPTTTPEDTLARACDFFAAHSNLAALGVAMFGPLDFARGRTLATPKHGWQDVPVVDTLEQKLGTPVAIDTDVNAAALAESQAHRALPNAPFVYITVGTGIGGGWVLDGRPVHGILHAEMGHMRVARFVFENGSVDTWAGSCPFHGACAEGLASGSAIEARTQTSARELASDDPVWAAVANALAQVLVNVTLTLSPSHVVLGGGVMRRPGLRERVAAEREALLANYLPRPSTHADGTPFVLEPRHVHSGLAGAFALARRSHLPSAPQNGPRSAP